jgi:hypothetical protein
MDAETLHDTGLNLASVSTAQRCRREAKGFEDGPGFMGDGLDGCDSTHRLGAAPSFPGVRVIEVVEDVEIVHHSHFVGELSLVREVSRLREVVKAVRLHLELAHEVVRRVQNLRLPIPAMRHVQHEQLHELHTPTHTTVSQAPTSSPLEPSAYTEQRATPRPRACWRCSATARALTFGSWWNK